MQIPDRAMILSRDNGGKKCKRHHCRFAGILLRSTVPAGRYIAPANTANCVQTYGGQCAPLTLYVRGPAPWNFDLSLVKKMRVTEQKNFQLRADFLNAFNKTNFSGVACAGIAQSCGQVTGFVSGPR